MFSRCKTPTVTISIISVALLFLAGCTYFDLGEKPKEGLLSYEDVRNVLEEEGLKLEETTADSLVENVSISPIAYQLNNEEIIFVYQFDSISSREEAFPAPSIQDDIKNPSYNALSAKNITVIYPTEYLETNTARVNGEEVATFVATENYDKVRQVVLQSMVVLGENFEFIKEELGEPVKWNFEYDMEKMGGNKSLEVYGVDTDRHLLNGIDSIEYKYAAFIEHNERIGGAPNSENRTKPYSLHHIRLKDIHRDMYIRASVKNNPAISYVANPEKEALWISVVDDTPEEAYLKFYEPLIKQDAECFLKWINHWEETSDEIIIYNAEQKIRYHVYDIKLNPDYPADMFEPDVNYYFGL